MLIARNTQRKSLLLGTFQARGEDNTRVRIRAYFTRVVNRNPQLQGSAGRGWWGRGSNPKHSGVAGARGSALDFPWERMHASRGSPAEGEALENEQSSKAKESRGSIGREEKGGAAKGGRTGAGEHAHAWYSGAWQSECRVTPRSRALEEVGGHQESQK